MTLYNIEFVSPQNKFIKAYRIMLSIVSIIRHVQHVSLSICLSSSCVLYFYLELNNRMLPQSPQSSFITLAADLKLQLTYYPCNRKSHKNC